MEIEIINKTKTYLKFELKGIDHSFCNILKKQLNLIPDVLTATYRVDHPLTKKIIFIIEGRKGKTSVMTCLKKAIKELKETNKEAKKAFKKIKI
jgi:DNA-directed RNA polymerase subunit L